MSDFHKVTAALNTMQFEPGANSSGKVKNLSKKKYSEI